MGLTIHWKLQAPEDWRKTQVLDVLNKMRQRALDLPVESVSEMISAGPDKASLARCENEEGWFFRTGGGYVDWPAGMPGHSYSQSYAPLEIHGFVIAVGEGCESMDVSLSRAPKTVMTSDGRKRTGRKGWGGRGFCKTQYASNISIPHFVTCHLSVVAMLDEAKRLGILAYVADEGNYLGIELTTGLSPGKRSIEALVKEVGEWNEMIAAFVASFREMEPEGTSSVSPITAHPDYSTLVSAGYSKERMVKLRNLLAQSIVK